MVQFSRGSAFFMMRKRNLVLIGMPASGKTTVGRRLAERLRRPFVDTDQWIMDAHGMRLRDIIAERGLDGFRAVEEAALIELDADDAVISTGGSAVYSAPGMQALRQNGRTIFLDAPLELLSARVGDVTARGMVIAPGQSFAELYAERRPLYQRYADLTVAVGDDPVETTVGKILARLR